MSYCDSNPWIICDKYDGFELSDDILKKYIHEFQSLGTLYTGLDWLYRKVRFLEEVVKKRLGPCLGYHYPIVNHPLLKDIPFLLVECNFHWYAVSVCNFVKLIGWISFIERKSSKKPNDYVKSVLPEVLAWRNKIAAHFAQTFSANDQRDKKIERKFSVIPQIGYVKGAFQAASVIISDDGNTSSDDTLKSWSLTKVHEGLLSRYVLPLANKRL
jgi:hypothetical protein